MATTPKHPITIRPTTKPPPVATIAASQRGTGADSVPVTKFAANTVVTPLMTFGFGYARRLYSFQIGAPRVVSPALRTAIIAASNARTDKLVKETA